MRAGEPRRVNGGGTVKPGMRSLAMCVVSTAALAASSFVIFSAPAAADGTVTVTTSAELVAAFADGSTDVIELAADITLTAEPTRPGGADDLVVEGNDHTLTGAASWWGLGTSDATGDLTVRDLTITRAGASGIRWVGGSVTLERTTLYRNAAAGDGGGLFADGAPAVTIIDSELRSNTSAGIGAAAWTDGLLTIEGSELSVNVSQGNGGAVATDGGTDLVEILTSNLEGNEANNGDGGAISSGGPVALTDSTVSTNIADYGGDGKGGAISADGDVTLVRADVWSDLASDGQEIYAPGHRVRVTSSSVTGPPDTYAVIVADDITLTHANVGSSGPMRSSSPTGTITTFGSYLNGGSGDPCDFPNRVSRGYNTIYGATGCSTRRRTS